MKTDLGPLLESGALTRRRLIQGLAAVLAPAAIATNARAGQTNAVDAVPLTPAVLPPGIRSRFVDNVNGIRMHVLEAGFEVRGRPGVLLLHGYPELAYSWRKVMLPIAAAGYHVIRPRRQRLRTDVRHRRPLRRRPRAVPHAQSGAGTCSDWSRRSATARSRR